MSEWQPIETAPKDGSLVLAYCKGNQMVAYWGRNGQLNPLGWIGGHCHINHIDQPSHWMPLPKNPES